MKIVALILLCGLAAEFEYRVLADIRTKDPECPSVPEITNLITDPDSLNATVEWDPSDCIIDGYVIYVDGQEYKRTHNTTLVISDLHACEEYTIGVAAFIGTAIGEKEEASFRTKTVTNFEEKVENFEVTLVSDNTLNLTWAPPTTVANCITSYFITWWGDVYGSSDFTVEAPTTYQEISPIIGCLNYTFQITPKVNSNEGHEDQISYKSGHMLPNPPELILNHTGKTNVSFTWRTDSKNINVCELKEIALRCEALAEDNENHSYIETILNVTTANPSFRYEMTIDGLSPLTNYTCSAITTTIAGKSNATVVTIQTLKDDCENQVDNFNVALVLNNALNITWAPSSNAANCITSYIITWWSDIAGNYYNYTIPSSATYLQISPVVGCLNYTFQITPKINDKEGSMYQISYYTDQKLPNPPHVTMIDIWQTNASFTIRTDTNDISLCRQTQLAIRCEALLEDNEDHDWVVWNSEVLVNESFSDAWYHPKINELSPYTNYTCNIVTTTTAGKSQKTSVKIQTLA